jgi:hypothetical protein
MRGFEAMISAAVADVSSRMVVRAEVRVTDWNDNKHRALVFWRDGEVAVERYHVTPIRRVVTSG